MSACHRVFATAELQEEILLHLPLNELLRSLQVCRAWHASTRRIRQALFLEPTRRKVDLDDQRWRFHIDSPATEDDTMDIDQRNHFLSDEDTDMETDENDSEYQDESDMTTDEEEDEQPLEYSEETLIASHLPSTPAAGALIPPSKGPILNPFINAFLEPESWVHSLRSLGIVTFPYTSSSDFFSPNNLGLVDHPDHLIWKLCCNAEAFLDPNASWRNMQVAQPAITEMRTTCRGYEVVLDEVDEVVPVDFQYANDENGDPQAVELETFGREYWVKNPEGVTLGQWAEMYQRHHKDCPHCVYMVDEFDEDYENEGAQVPLMKWFFDGAWTMRKLGGDVEGGDGREVFVRDPGGDEGLDERVLPGSGFTARYVLERIEEVLRPVPLIPVVVDSGDEEDDGDM